MSNALVSLGTWLLTTTPEGLMRHWWLGRDARITSDASSMNSSSSIALKALLAKVPSQIL
jgi:hypothetical protein